MERNQSTRTVSTAEKVFQIVEFIDEVEEARLKDVAEELDLAQSTAHDHLSTLVESEYLVKDGYSYRLGLKFLNHGIRVRSQYELHDAARESLEQIAAETGEIVWLVTEEYGRAVYLEKALGNQAIQPYGRVGSRVDLHSIAAGKAILANLSDERVDEIVEKWGLTAHTEETITERSVLDAELAEIRSAGVAFNDEELMEGFRAVAAPIITDGEPVGSIAVSGPKNRMPDSKFRESLPELILGTTNAIELSLVAE